MVMRPTNADESVSNSSVFQDPCYCTIFITFYPPSVFTPTIMISSSLPSVQGAANQWETFLTACSSTVGKSTVRDATPELLIDRWSAAKTSHPRVRAGRSLEHLAFDDQRGTLQCNVTFNPLSHLWNFAAFLIFWRKFVLSLSWWREPYLSEGLVPWNQARQL